MRGKRKITIIAVVAMSIFIVACATVYVTKIRQLIRGRLKNECARNMRTIESALNAYYSKYGAYPFLSLGDNARPLHSWRSMILEQLGEKELCAMYDFNEPWDGPNNKKLHNMMPDVFRCPLHDRKSHCPSILIVHDSWKIPYHDEDLNRPIIIETNNSTINWLEPGDFPASHFDFGMDKGCHRSNKTLLRLGVHYRSHKRRKIRGTAIIHGGYSCISEDTKPEALKALADPEKRDRVKITYPWGKDFGIVRAVLIDDK